jgi:hypothetical protein
MGSKPKVGQKIREHAEEIHCLLYLGAAANLATDRQERQMEEIVRGHSAEAIVADRECVAIISFIFGMIEFK